MKLKALANALAEALYPPSCPFCGQTLEQTVSCCNHCRSLITLRPTRLEIPLAQNKLLSCSAFYLYEGAVKEAIHRMKFYDCKMIGTQLGNLLAELPEVQTLLSTVDCITPVPISKKRRLERGYNQSQVLAEALSDRSGCPCLLLLEKHKHTVPQSGLERQDRLQNVQGAYRPAKNSSVAGKRILLIDDVVTTGATMASCADALYAGGAELVVGMAISYSVLS